MATEKKQRKPRTVDPDQRLVLVNAQIERFEKLAADREELLAKTEALAAERREALAKTNEKLEALRGKRDRHPSNIGIASAPRCRSAMRTPPGWAASTGCSCAAFGTKGAA